MEQVLGKSEEGMEIPGILRTTEFFQGLSENRTLLRILECTRGFSGKNPVLNRGFDAKRRS
jgi:hypothetical protein